MTTARLTRTLAALLCALVALTTLAAARPASAQATRLPRPVLLVGGFTSPQWFMDLWAAGLADTTDTDPRRIVGVDLTLGGLVSNKISANGPIRRALDELYARHGERVDIVAMSQGALASRWLLKTDPTARDKVARFVSLGGINAGGEFDPDSPIGALCGDVEEPDEWPEACRELFYLPPEGPGGTDFLRELNGGDPTPGDVAYYHVYTEIPTDGEIPPAEAHEPYGWGVPLLGATNVSAQQACAPHGYGNRIAPHAALWSVVDPIEWDSVQTELVLDALYHDGRPAIDAAATCAGR